MIQPDSLMDSSILDESVPDADGLYLDRKIHPASTLIEFDQTDRFITRRQQGDLSSDGDTDFLMKHSYKSDL